MDATPGIVNPANPNTAIPVPFTAIFFHVLTNLMEDAHTIPSTNNVSLEARIHRGFGVNAKTCVILTHPYGRLGGDLRNNVVDACFRFFAAQGFMTVRFNFRGVGKSTGWGTFSALGELDDVISVYKYMKSNLAPSYFLICGYSFGSVVSSAASCEILECIGVICISYPYSVLWTLTCFNSQPFLDALTSSSLRTIPKLFIMGSSDNFTNLKDFQEFIKTLTGKKSLKILDRVDHFWFGCEEEVVDAIKGWVTANAVLPK